MIDNMTAKMDATEKAIKAALRVADKCEQRAFNRYMATRSLEAWDDMMGAACETGRLQGELSAYYRRQAECNLMTPA